MTQHCIGSARNTDQNFFLQLIGPWLESSEPQDATHPHSQRAQLSITLWLGDTQCTAVTWSLAAPTTAPNSMEKILLWASRVLGTAGIQFPQNCYLLFSQKQAKTEVSKPYKIYLRFGPYCSYILLHILHWIAGVGKGSTTGCRERSPASETCREASSESRFGGKTT